MWLANGISIASDVKGNGSGNRHSSCKRFASHFYLAVMKWWCTNRRSAR